MIYLLLWAVLIPMVLALGLYFLTIRKPRLARFLFGIMAVLVILLLITYQRQRLNCESESGDLLPGEFVTAEEDRCRGNSPDAITFRMGGIIVVGGSLRSHVNILATPSHVIVALDRDKVGVSISSTLFDDTGAVLANIVKNHFETVGALTCQRPDLSTLIVRKWYGTELLYVKYANSNTIEIRGRFAYPKLEPIRVTRDQIYQGDTPIGEFDCVQFIGGPSIETIARISDFPSGPTH